MWGWLCRWPHLLPCSHKPQALRQPEPLAGRQPVQSSAAVMRVAPCPTAAAVLGPPPDQAVTNSSQSSSSSSSRSTGPVVLFPGETFSTMHIPFSFRDSEDATRVSEL